MAYGEMDAVAAESGSNQRDHRNPRVSTRFRPGGMSGLTWDGTAEHVSRDQVNPQARTRTTEGRHFPCPGDHKKTVDNHPSVDAQSAVGVMTTLLLESISGNIK